MVPEEFFIFAFSTMFLFQCISIIYVGDITLEVKCRQSKSFLWSLYQWRHQFESNSVTVVSTGPSKLSWLTSGQLPRLDDNGRWGTFGGGPQGLMDFGDQPPSLPLQMRVGQLAGQGWELGCDQFL